MLAPSSFPSGESPLQPTRRRLVQLACAATLGGPAWARGPGSSLGKSPGDGPLILGQSVPLTGPTAHLGRNYVQGAQLVFDQVNAAGGIGRRAIELRIQDDGYEADRCADNTRRFIREDVFALFGYVGTPTSLAAMPQALEARVPFVAPRTGAQAVREPLHQQVFVIRASYREELSLVVSKLRARGVRRVALLRQGDSYGDAGLDGLTRALAAQGLGLLGQASIERNSLDVSAAVRALAPLRPEAIVLVCTYQAAAAFIRAARKAGFAGLFAAVSFVGTQDMIDTLGREGAGVMISQVMPSPYIDGHPLAIQFRAAARKAGGRVAITYSGIEGYLAASVLVAGLQAAQRMGRLSREGLVDGLESLGRREIAGFPIELGPARHAASDFVELSTLVGDGTIRT